jgi:uncharacterized YccA/Bax inhibitor family protein
MANQTIERSGNPVLKDDTFAKQGVSDDPMTLDGTVNRTGFLLVLVVMSAAWTWNEFYTAGLAAVTVPMWTGIIGGFIVAMVTIFKTTWAPYTAPMYALLEGFAIGGISAMAEQRFEGIVIQAVVLTFGTLFVLLMAYRSGLIKATENFKLGVVAATGAVALLYLVDLGMRFFGNSSMPVIHESSPMGIGFSLVVVTIAALNLVLDFDFIEKGVEQRAPRHMEWYGAFGLLVTLVWLYLEILHLLTKLKD